LIKLIHLWEDDRDQCLSRLKISWIKDKKW
jgi:hypothetical protein